MPPSHDLLLWWSFGGGAGGGKWVAGTELIQSVGRGRRQCGTIPTVTLTPYVFLIVSPFHIDSEVCHETSASVTPTETWKKLYLIKMLAPWGLFSWDLSLEASYRWLEKEKMCGDTEVHQPALSCTSPTTGDSFMDCSPVELPEECSCLGKHSIQYMGPSGAFHTEPHPCDRVICK